ncbi:hypothetical protein [Kushneria sp. TE3]|uniref:hypothetical protein n=1 Tax=Kushneria sp. TE3 TaxID=3449832 RepID=UPI003F6894D4
MAETYGCDVNWADGTGGRGYLKCFPQSRHLGVINEITGYLTAKACSLPVPKKAGIVELNDDLIASLQLAGGTDLCRFGFIVSESPGKSPNSFYPHLPVEVKARLANQTLTKWPSLGKLIAFDDWLANPDRNLGNFLIASNDEIYIIDHSNLPIGINWQAADLVVNRHYQNMMIAILSVDGSLPIHPSFVVAAAGDHPDAYAVAKEELIFWWNAFLSTDMPRRQALENFVEVRAGGGSTRIAQKFA